MSVQTVYPHIEEAAGESPRLRRSPRIRVAQIVMDYLAHGWSVEEMCRQHAGLTPAEAHSAMAYYFDHQAEIDAEIQAEVDQVQSDRTASAPSTFLARMRAQGRV
jgi:uncharacterized protein (DUF433 family)